MDQRPGVTHARTPSRGPGLRPGQRRSLAAWAEALRQGRRSQLIVVPVGYGKTVIGVGSFDVAANLAGADLCLYLTPGDVLRTQVYRGLERAMGVLGSTREVRKALADNAAPERLVASRANVVVGTYQQVASSPETYSRLARHRRVHLVCDEAHHLGESGRWAAAVGSIGAASTLLLSATPVRLDREAIAGAPYAETPEGLVIAPLVHVSMRQAWEERRILKRMSIQMKDYTVQLRDREGRVHAFTASQMAESTEFDQACLRDELRWNEDYVQPLIREFAVTLENKMRLHPGLHQGLVFAATTEHANHLGRLFAQAHPNLRVAVVHSGPDIPEAEAEQRLRAFHLGLTDVLIQVRKASEGFDAPTVSVLLKLDAVFSREPVIQQLGRGLRFNHGLTEAENMLHVFLARDVRLGPIISHLEREQPAAPVERRGAADHVDELRDVDAPEDEAEFEPFDDEDAAPEILSVEEAGDAFLDDTGRLVEGHQFDMFGGPPVAPPPGPVARTEIIVVDIAKELDDAIEACRLWTSRAARLRAGRAGGTQNHFAVLNAEFARETGKRGALSTAQAYREKADWMKRKYLELLG